jgi:hypothetical protein
MYEYETPAVQVLDDPDGRQEKFFVVQHKYKKDSFGRPVNGPSWLMGSEIVGVTT